MYDLSIEYPMRSPSPNPYVAVCPYLPLAQPVVFAGWWLGPASAFDGRWLSPAIKEATHRFLACFRTQDGRPIDRPSLLARVDGGVDGALPNDRERLALGSTIDFITLDANPYWSTDTQTAGWSIATTDNADLWLQPLNIEEGFFATGRGSRVNTTVGGHSFYDPDCAIPPPLEVKIPTPLRLDQELAAASFDVLAHRADDLAAELLVAMRWVGKSWANSASISWEDRVLFLKIASEGFSGTDSSIESARRLRARYASCLSQEGKGVGADDLLWRPDEPTLNRSWTDRSGSTRTAALSAFEHWYMALADTRNEIAHSGHASTLDYSEGTAYDGPLVEIGDRVLRELIKLSLGLSGHPAVWRRGLGRASFRAWQHFSAEEPSTLDLGAAE